MEFPPLTIGHIERLEDSLGESIDVMLTPGGLTVRRVRAVARIVAEATDAELDAWLTPRNLYGCRAQVAELFADALVPPEEAAEHLPAGEGGDGGGNSPPGAGS